MPEQGNKVLNITYGGATSAGIKERNEDAFAVLQPSAHVRQNKGCVACIADGASCSENAQLASETSVTTFIQDYFSTPESWDVKTSAAKVLSSLNSWLNYQGQLAGNRHNSLVTTFSSAIFKSTHAHILHTGDSRVYRYRDGELIQLTQDHSMLQSGNNTLLTRALGMDTVLKVDYQKRSIRKNDLFLFTTDGVHDVLDQAQISRKLAYLAQCELKPNAQGRQAEFEIIASELNQQALDSNSKDNNTCLIVRIEAVPLEDINEAHRKLTQLTIPPPMQPGHTLDEFHIKEIIHAGTRSHVYIAEHPRYREQFVLKVPSENFAEDPLYLEAFVREQWVGRRINDSQVMKIHEPLPGSQFLYHICEHVPGITLRQWIHDNPHPDLAEVRRLTEKIVSALRIFQRMRMLHRDLKPENIMVTPDREIKLIDFGTVKVPGLEEISSPVKEDSPVGSVDYIAPEYLMGDLGLYRSDIFSLGVIVYEMICGKLPFPSLLRKDGKVSSYGEWKYSSAMSKRKDIPLWLDLVLKKACAPRPTERYQSMSEFLQDLSLPNQTLIENHASAPLIEKDPLTFWKIVSAILLLIVLGQWTWPYL